MPRRPPYFQSPWFYLGRENFYGHGYTKNPPRALRAGLWIPTLQVPAYLTYYLPSHMPCALTHPLSSSLAIIPIHDSHQELHFPVSKSGLTDQPYEILRLLLKYLLSDSMKSLIYTGKKIYFLLKTGYFLTIFYDFTFSQ